MKEKVLKALEKVRPHLQADGGDVELFADESRTPFQEFMQLVNRLPGEALRGEMNERDLRMANEIAQEFASGIACGSDD